jgi:glycosyltransferase involved in cell wall biosynthesis
MAVKQPRTVAVIIPTYNATKPIDRTLVSAIEPLRHCADVEGLELDGEIVVVDDLSTDETPQIVEAWAAGESAVRLVRNEGVRQSTGLFLFFLDSDNIFYPKHIFCA